LSEWHITPEYINDNWTEEEFGLMIEKLNKRLSRDDSDDGLQYRASGKGQIPVKDTMMLADLEGKGFAKWNRRKE